jgi:predicted alpha/beta-hydrolase family hydrolase
MERLILFAHGAGVGSASPWMRSWAARLGAFGRVASFDYPYMKEGRRRPDRPEVLIAAHRAALQDARRQAAPGARVVLAGKSMGSRMGCHLANEPGIEVDALVCFGYPLVSQSGKLRNEVLLGLHRPVLFIQGTRDELCPLRRLATVRKKMSAPNDLHVVRGGDHSLIVPKSRSQDEADAAMLAAIQGFLSAHA